MIVCPVPSNDRFFIGQLIKDRVSIVGLKTKDPPNSTTMLLLKTINNVRCLLLCRYRQPQVYKAGLNPYLDYYFSIRLGVLYKLILRTAFEYMKMERSRKVGD